MGYYYNKKEADSVVGFFMWKGYGIQKRITAGV